MHKSPQLEALGTHWWFEIFDDNISNPDTLWPELFAQMQTFEQTYSRFRPDSDISILNTTGRVTAPKATLLALLRYGVDAYTTTGGVFNILTGHIQHNRGYDAEYSFTHKGKTEVATNPLTDLVLTDAEIILKQGAVDIGGYGKGWLIDQLADWLKAQGIQYFLINGGGDLYGTSERGAPIEIALAHPFTPGEYIGTTTLLNEALGGSSPALRRWRNPNTNTEQTHLLNLQSNTLPQATFIKAPTATKADLLATTISISPEFATQQNNPYVTITSESAFFKSTDFNLRS